MYVRTHCLHITNTRALLYVRSWIARENAKENRLDGEKVARRQRQAYRCQSVNRKSLTAPRPSRILHFLPPRTRHPPRSLHPGVTPFAILLAQLSMSFSCCTLFSPTRCEPLRRDGGEGTELYCKSIYCEHSDGAPSFQGADYKFKCKPTRSRRVKVRNAPSQVRPRMMRHKPEGSPTALR